MTLTPVPYSGQRPRPTPRICTRNAGSRRKKKTALKHVRMKIIQEEGAIDLGVLYWREQEREDIWSFRKSGILKTKDRGSVEAKKA